MLTDLVRSAPHDVQIIELIGRVDGTNSTQLSDIVNTALTQHRTHILLDMRAVDYINSSGLRMLVQLYKLVARRKGELAVVNPADNVKRLFALVGLDTVFTIYHDADWHAHVADSIASGGNRATYYSL